MLEDILKETIRDIADFPQKGIIFRDITPVLKDPKAFNLLVDDLHKRYSAKKIDVVAGIESRGFIFGAPLSLRLGAAFVPIRKKGKLPYKTVEASYDLEYGSATIEMHTDSIEKGQNVVVIDDLLATGGTANAACKLVEGLGGKVLECAFVVELGSLNGRAKLGRYPVYSQIRF